MHFQQLIFIAVALLASTVFASPLPSFSEIEDRWSRGESEKQIHADHHIREASPSWLANREANAGNTKAFTYAPDKRTSDSRKRAVTFGKRDDEGLKSKMKTFVNDFWQSNGKGRLISRSVESEDAPVLKPKKSMRYYFTS